MRVQGLAAVCELWRFLTDRHWYVCDGCMQWVRLHQIYDLADGEHVLCYGCKAKAS